MLRTALKNLLAHKLRLLTTALAVTLGVAFMAGTLVLTDTISQTFDNLFADVYKGTDAVVRAKAAFEGPQGTGEQRGRVDASLVPTVRAVPGVAAPRARSSATPGSSARTARRSATRPTARRRSAGAWTDIDALNPFTLVAGSPPRRPTTRSSSTRRARTTATSPSATPRRCWCTVRRSGCGSRASSASAAPTRPGGASSVLFTPPAAQRLLAAARQVRQHHRRRRTRASRRPSWSTRVERGAAARASRPSPARRSRRRTRTRSQKGLSFFNTFLLIFAVVALLVGAFMIFNTFSITVAQRTRENGLLRALGASRRQVLASVLVEAFVVGVIASVVGLGLGIVVAIGLKA